MTSSSSDSLHELLATLLEGRVEVHTASADPVTGIVEVKMRLPEMPNLAERAELLSWVNQRFYIAEGRVAEDGFVFAPTFI